MAQHFCDTKWVFEDYEVYSLLVHGWKIYLVFFHPLPRTCILTVAIGDLISLLNFRKNHKTPNANSLFLLFFFVLASIMRREILNATHLFLSEPYDLKTK